jgi:hypothetical protein
LGGEAIIFLFALGLGIVGALLFVLGVLPTFEGSAANMFLTVFGVVLMIIGIGMGVVMGALGEGSN